MTRRKAVKDFDDKSIRNEDAEIKTPQVEERYFFPSLGVSVKAKNREEALIKAKQITKK